MSNRATLLTEFPDNTNGQIMPSNLRDFVNSAVLPQDLVAGGNITITPNGTQQTIAAGSNVTTQGNTFNGASQLVQLDGSGNLNVAQNITANGITLTAAISGLCIQQQGNVLQSTATGTTGQIMWGTISGTTYLYVCVATNTWRRVTMSSF
jgi:hypothetical protein